MLQFCELRFKTTKKYKYMLLNVSFWSHGIVRIYLN